MLFVCTENICRSPLAEGLMRHHLQVAGRDGSVKVSSAGTMASRPGARPDQRVQKVVEAAGVNLGRIRASRVTEKELVRSDYILAMDNANLQDLIKVCPTEHRHKISLLLSYLSGGNLDEVPDPYYGSVEGFEKVFKLIDAAVVDLISYIADQAH